MKLRRVHPDADIIVDLAAPTASDQLDELYRVPRQEWLRINLVVSIDGSAAGSDGTSETLTRGADRRVLGAIRRAADAVLVGAQSMRAEGYRLPRTAALVVITSSGDLSGHAFADDVPPGRLIVLCSSRGEARARESLGATEARVIVVPDAEGRMSPTDILDTLHSFGLRSLVCEGGPSLASQFIDAGLVQELCLTTVPVFAPEGNRAFDLVEAPHARLRQLLVDDVGATFAVWSLS